MRHPGLRALGLGVLVTAVVTAGVLGMGWLVGQGGADRAGAKVHSGEAADVGAGDGPAPYPVSEVGCSRLVAEGTVSAVGPLSDPLIRVVLTVTRRYVPEHGPSEVTFFIGGGAKPSCR